MFGSIQTVYDTTNARGIIANFDVSGVPDLVKRQLGLCAENGQTIMGLHLRHSPLIPLAAPTWEIPSSFEGKYYDNFCRYLDLFSTFGFQHLTLSIGYQEGLPFDDVALANNFNVIVKAWEALHKSSIPEFDVDPFDEASPRAITTPDEMWFLKTLWITLCDAINGPTDWNRMAGLSGYSNVDGIDPQEYVNGIVNLYPQDKMPNAFPIHCYRPENYGPLRDAMIAAGIGQAVYLGETPAQDLVYPRQDFLFRECWQTTLGAGDFSNLATGKYRSA